MRLLPSQRLTECPHVPLPIDSGNYFGSRVRIFMYAIAPQFLYSATENRVYRVGVNTALPFDHAPSVRGSAGNTVWSGRVCPPDLLSTLQQTILLRLNGRGTPGTAWGTQHNRLFDASSGSGWRLGAERQTNTEINPYSASFGDTGYGVNAFVVPPYNPLSIGMVYLGSNTVRHYVNGRFAHQDTVTVDANASGTDTRLDFAGSTSANVDYQFGMWLKGSLTDMEMADLMANPWQVLRPMRRRGFEAAGGGSAGATLVGEEATTSQGALSPVVDASVALTGLAATTAQGTLSPLVEVSVALTGQAATTAQGTLSPLVEVSVALTGQAATTAQGVLSPLVEVSVALTGQAATTAQGALSPLVEVSVALTGQAATTAQGALSPLVEVSVALTGLAITTAHGTIVGSTSGDATIALTGMAITTDDGVLSPQVDVSVALTGLAVTTAHGTIVPSTGWVADLVGQSTTLSQGTMVTTIEKALTGLAATTSQGALTPGLDKALTGLAATTAQGSVGTDISVTLTGQATTLAQGSMSVSLSSNVTLALTGLRIVAGFGTLSFPSPGSDTDLYVYTEIAEHAASIELVELFARVEEPELVVQ
jgi:hypothetical protein